MTAVIEVEGLHKVYVRHKRFGRREAHAVDGLDLSVPEGGVFGFLGPNGSGKTTTIRCLLGLVRATEGRCRILGAEPGDLASVIGRIGSIVETPLLFPTFSGRRNLRLLADLGGFAGRDVDGPLDRVGLLDRADDQVRTYSLGMRQRLAIAATLLKDPDLLVLDEPANGLDPAGIREIRELLRSLADEGRTVFVSSHILSEVQQTCDRVAILSRGRCVTSGTVDEVLHAGASSALILKTADLDRALATLAEKGIAAIREGDHLRAEVDPARAAQLNHTMAEAGHWLTELRPDEASLEDVFLRLTEDLEPAGEGDGP
jgi:ABC-type multidrug transport system ATPase subunit